MATPEVQSASPPRKRRWYQFSLRTLMIVMLLASVGMSWLTVRVQRGKKQRQAVEEITKSGACIFYDREPEEGSSKVGPAWLRKLVGHVFFPRVEVVVFFDGTDDDLSHVESLIYLRGLALSGSRITDRGLAHLESLPQLEVLELSSPGITDAGLVHLQRLKNLETLGVSSTSVTDAGMVYLKGLPELRKLIIAETSVTDAGLEHLKGLPRLESLSLGHLTTIQIDRTNGAQGVGKTTIGIAVTDAGLLHLKELPQLKGLSLYGTKVTDEGVRHLREALPNCQIYK